MLNIFIDIRVIALALALMILMDRSCFADGKE